VRLLRARADARRWTILAEWKTGAPSAVTLGTNGGVLLRSARWDVPPCETGAKIVGRVLARLVERRRMLRCVMKIGLAEGQTVSDGVHAD
jgi:hypothetical protein